MDIRGQNARLLSEVIFSLAIAMALLRSLKLSLIPLPSQLIGPTAVATAFKRAQESLVFKHFEAQKDREKHPATPVSTAYRVLPRL